MYFVQCPRCGDPVELPDEAVGKDRTDPWNIVGCDNCDCTFDFDDEDVQFVPDAPPVQED